MKAIVMSMDNGYIDFMPAPIDEKIILENVLKAWREFGYQKATTRKIAEMAGITEVTLFRRFGDKVSLFRAALEFEARLFVSDDIVYTGSLVNDVEKIVLAYDRLLNRSASIIFDILLEAPRNTELSEIRLVPMKAIQQIASIIKRYQQEGKLQGESPLDAVLSLLSPIFMAKLVSRTQPELNLQINHSKHIDTFLQGWTKDIAK